MSIDFSGDMEAPLVTKSLTPGDEAEISLRPRTLDDTTGQEKAKGNLKIYIEAALRRRHCQRVGRQQPRHLRPGH